MPAGRRSGPGPLARRARRACACAPQPLPLGEPNAGAGRTTHFEETAAGRTRVVWFSLRQVPQRQAQPRRLQARRRRPHVRAMRQAQRAQVASTQRTARAPRWSAAPPPLGWRRRRRTCTLQPGSRTDASAARQRRAAQAVQHQIETKSHPPG
eukprot:gene5868-biopygen2802